MPFQSRAQQRWAFATRQPFARRWGKQTNFAGLPERKDAGTDAGAMLHGPGGMLATPGLGGRKWGNRTKRKDCTCGVATKESLGPGITRIRGNLCNVHGRYGPCDAALSGKKPKGKKGGGKGKKPKKPIVTPEQRAQQHTAEQAQNRTKVLGSLGIAPDGQQALEALRAGQAPDAAAIERGGFVKAGLVEQAADGSYRLTPSGRATLAAASSGDAGRAGDIISSARDRTSARTARQDAAAKRKQDAEARRAAAAAKKPKGGGGGKGSSAASDATTAREAARNQREQERRQDRTRRQQEHEADRAQRQQEHAADRAQRQREHAQDRADRLAARRQRNAPAPQPTPPSRGSPIVRRGSANRGGPRRMPQTTHKAADPGDYLIVEDRTKPTTWHLQVKRNGTPDHGLMGSAWAALHGGFRGNTYQGPNKSEAIAKLRALYASEKMDTPAEKSFIVFKDDTDAWRWVARTTTAYRDRDGEIITTKALEQDAARMTATRHYGPLRYWHIGQPDPFNPTAPWGPGIDVGDCDYSIVIGRTSIESGTFKSHAIGRAFAESAPDYELSPGFFHPPDQPDAAGEYTTIRRFERSVVPTKYGRASNLFTGMTVKEHRMDQQTYDARVKAFLADMNAKGVPEQVAAGALAGMEQADKSATAQGIAYKSDDAPAVYTAPDGTQGLILDGRFVALKAAAPPMDAEDDPAQGGDSGADEATEDDGGGDYVGDMSPDDFRAMLIDAFGEAINQFGTGISGKMAEMDDALKAMGYARMKSEQDATTTRAEIAALKARLAQLTGDMPAVTLATEAEAALKSAGPQSPPDPAAPQVPDDPNRPFAPLTAQLLPQLYGAKGPLAGYGPNGWTYDNGLPPNTGGN